MIDYIKIVKHDTSLSVCFYIDKDNIMSLAEKIEGINKDAYMNSYNWEVFFNYYLSKNYPSILEDMGSDPEAGMYVAYYDLTTKNEDKANKLVDNIIELVENEDRLLSIIKNEGDNIEWN